MHLSRQYDDLGRSLALKQEIDISWKNLSVYVGQPISKKLKTPPEQAYQGVKKNQVCDDLNAKQSNLQFKQILKDQTGYALHGETLAIMGPSGAGKTTLLAMLTQKFNQSSSKVVSGDCLANGKSYNNSDFTSFGVFVMQNDLLFPCLTVRETILFSARMRLRGSEQSKKDKVDKLIKDLQLTHCQDTYIGSTFIKGISGGERKRACIGIELVADPIVLVLDEPTSGLDSFTAFTLMNILRDLARNEKKCIIFSIHTPSYDIFTLIDRLLLLQNGKMIYQGSTQAIIPYIQSLGIEVPEDQNICDFFMYEVNSKRGSLLNSSNFENFLRQQNDNEQDERITNKDGFLQRYTKNSFCYQFKVLVKRSYANFVRNPQLLRARMFLTCKNTGVIKVIFSVFFTTLYWGRAKNEPSNPSSQVDVVNQYVSNLQGVLFNIGASCFYSALGPVISLFPRERSIFLKEENSKTYSILPYFLAKVIVEIQFIFITPFISGTCYYLALQGQYEIGSYFQFLLLCICISFCGNGLGIMAGSLFPDAAKSAALAPLVITPLQVFGGQFANFGNISLWVSWVQYISPFKYYFEGFVRIFFEGKLYFINTDQGQQIIDPVARLNFILGYWTCLGILILLGFLFHILAIVFLKALIRKLNV